MKKTFLSVMAMLALMPVAYASDEEVAAKVDEPVATSFPVDIHETEITEENLTEGTVEHQRTWVKVMGEYFQSLADSFKARYDALVEEKAAETPPPATTEEKLEI